MRPKMTLAAITMPLMRGVMPFEVWLGLLDASLVAEGATEVEYWVTTNVDGFVVVVGGGGGGGVKTGTELVDDVVGLDDVVDEVERPRVDEEVDEVSRSRVDCVVKDKVGTETSLVDWEAAGRDLVVVVVGSLPPPGLRIFEMRDWKGS
jgi:hypothetical protein